MISKRTSDEKLKKRLEQALRENIKKRKAQKEMRETLSAKDANNKTSDDLELVKNTK